MSVLEEKTPIDLIVLFVESAACDEYPDIHELDSTSLAFAVNFPSYAPAIPTCNGIYCKDLFTSRQLISVASITTYRTRLSCRDGFNAAHNGGTYDDDATTATPAPPNNPFISGRAQTVYLGLEDIGNIGLNASGSGLFYWSKDESRNLQFMSSSYLINVNEKIKSILGGLVVGGEYIKTDAYYYLDEWTYLNTIPFYKTPSAKGWHAFTAIPVADHLTARLGYYSLKQTPYETVYATYSNEVKMNSVYGQLRLDF